MSFFKIFRGLNSVNLAILLSFSVMSALSNAGVLMIVNKSLSNFGDRDKMFQFLILFIGCTTVYYITQRIFMIQTSEFSNDIITNLRKNFLDRLSSATLPEVEGLNKNEVYVCITSETQTLADVASIITTFLQSSIVIIIVIFYIGLSSYLVSFLVVIFIIAIVLLHQLQSRFADKGYLSAIDMEGRVSRGFTEIIEGFKELKLNSAKLREIRKIVLSNIIRVSCNRIELQTFYTNMFVVSETSFLLLIGIIAFVIPLAMTTSNGTAVTTTISALFLIGPISNLVNGIRMLQRINSSAKAIYSLEARLNKLAYGTIRDDSFSSTFDKINLFDLSFSYEANQLSSSETDQSSRFTLGPLSFEICQGQIIFLTGDNGSGKSTLIKLICGLYDPRGGLIKIDGQPIADYGIDRYRSLFSVIFSENYLFKTIHGLTNEEREKAVNYLKMMDLTDSVSVSEQDFNTISLSSGQRKRLAMVTLLLEDRPVCIFDEWAATQDPHFRKTFYREILPSLKEKGKTIIVITHDEKYYEMADFRIHLKTDRHEFDVTRSTRNLIFDEGPKCEEK